MINNKYTYLLLTVAISTYIFSFSIKEEQEQHYGSNSEKSDVRSGIEPGELSLSYYKDVEAESSFISPEGELAHREHAELKIANNEHQKPKDISINIVGSVDELSTNPVDSFSDVKENIYSCFDFDLLSFLRTPECSENIDKVYDIAAKTIIYEEMRFAIATLYTETDPDTVHQFIQDYSSKTQSSEYDVFDLLLVAYSSGDTTRGIEILYDNFWNLNDENRELLIPTLTDTTVNILRHGPSGYSAYEEANRILDDTTNLSALSRTRLEAAMEGFIDESEYVVGKIVSWPPAKSAELVIELYSECEYLIDLCTSVLEDGGPVKQYFLFASQNHAYSETDKRLFASLASLQGT